MKTRIILTAFVFVLIIGVFLTALSGLTLTTGTYISDSVSRDLIVSDRGLYLLTGTDSAMFAKLTTGDRIAILHLRSASATVYPPSTKVLLCIRLGSGTVPEAWSDHLEELGWL